MKAEVIPQSDYFNWSLSQLSRGFGIARETVSKRLTDANVKASGEKRGHPVFSVKDAASAILLHGVGGSFSFSNPETMAPSDRRHWYASENDRLKLEKEQGLLVSVDDVREQLVEIANISSNVLEILPDEIERDFPDKSPEIIQYIENKVHIARNQLADRIEEIE
ncbi:MAG: DUF1441 family protein [Gammaproteobacteria bacterium]|nr:DUF1441 family protein [Gammaproteobacteria bacterium]